MMRRTLALLLLALLPGAAMADPITVFAALEPVIGATLAAATATVVSYGSYIITAAAIAYGQMETRRKARNAAAAARAAYNASLSDRTVTVLQADPPHRVVLGRSPVGGHILAMFTTDKTGTRTNGATYTKPDALRHLVVVFAAHRCYALNDLKLDGYSVNLDTLDANGWVTTGEFASEDTIRREVVLAAGASWTAPSAMTVTSCVEQVSGGDNQQAGTYTLSSGDTVVTNTSAFSVAISLTYTSSTGSVRVSYHLGADDQAADTYLTGLLGSTWTTDHALAGLAYAVITLDLENQRFQGGPPGMVFDVSGALVYDTRRNKHHNPLMLGADAGVLPTGMSWGGLRGLTGTVLSAGVDDSTGMLYVELRLQGTATSTGGAVVNLSTADSAAVAAAGEDWSSRLMVRVVSNTTAPDYARGYIVSFDSGGALTSEAAGTDIDLTVTTRAQASEAADAALVSGAVGVGLRLQVGVQSGSAYNTVLRVMLPQLWRGTSDVMRWSDNPALLIAHFLRSRQGMAVAWDDVNDTALVAAANACDTLIPLVVDGVETTGRTYTANGAYTTDEALESVLEGLANSMAGFASYGADWRIVPGTWTPDVMTLTDADLDGQVSIVQAGAAMDQMFNGVRSQYLPLADASPADAIYSNATFVAADGAELWTDDQLDWTNNAARVRNLQRIKTERARAAQVIRYPAKLTAWPLQVGDRVAVTNAEYGWTDKLYQVTDWQFNLLSSVVLVLQEDDPSIYDLADAAVSDPTPNTGLPNPWSVPQPTGISVASGTNHLLVQPDGTIVTRVRVSWSASTSPYVISAGSHELLWRIAGRDAANVWRTVTTAGDAVGEYLLGANDGDVINWQLTAINSMGRRSKTVHGSHTVVGKTAAPQDVPSVTASLIYGAVRVEVPASTEPDVREVELRRGASWAAGVPLVGTTPTIMRGTEYLWAWPAAGLYTIWAKYRDTSGNESFAAVSTAINVNDAIKLGSDGIDVDLAGINLCANSSFQIDYDADGLADGWTAYQAGSSGTITRSLYAGRITGLGQRVYTTALGPSTADRVGVRRDIAVGPGAIQQACISAYAWGSSGRTGVLLVYAMQGTTVLDTYTTSVTFGGTADWKRLIVTVPSFNALADTIRVYLWMSEGTGASAVMVLDDVLVEEASLPSAWHPSPLDELIDTDGLEGGAATEVVTVTNALHTHTVTGAGSGGGTLAIVDCSSTWTNTLGEDVLVEVSASWNVTVVAVNSFGYTATPGSYLWCTLYNGGTYVSTVGEFNPEQPVPDIAAGATARWTCARSLTAVVPAGHELRANIDNSINYSVGADGTTVTLRDGVLRLTVIKR